MRLKVSKVTMLKWFPDCPSEFLTGKYACIKAKSRFFLVVIVVVFVLISI